MGLIVDNFAGGGGASTGIEIAIGRSVDIAINHDPAAIAMHKANHPSTKHYCESVWEVNPKEAVGENVVDLAWFSPDCKHFSKAKGGKPVEKNIRGLAWVAVRWAATVKPRVIMLENVEEFKTWGPLIKDKEGNLYPDPKKKGKTFSSFVNALKKLGYEVEWRELKACDYGAPTIRKRFFLVARCDGKPIIFPKPTHGKGLKPYIAAKDIIDWNLECPSIFDRKKPLSENTLIRIARGIKKFIIEEDKPFILNNKAMFLQHYYTHQGEEVRASDVREPIATIPTANRFGLVTAFIAQQFKSSVGHAVDRPLATVTTVNKANLVTAFLLKYYGSDIGQSCEEPLHTVTTKDRFGLVTIKGQEYKIIDIGMRMLQPHELFAAQGFPKDYIIDKDYTGKKYPKTQQTARCGNAVPPPLATALVKANLPELCEKVNIKQAV